LWTGAENQAIVSSIAEARLKNWSALAAEPPGRIGK
jgi:hypothetical protein